LSSLCQIAHDHGRDLGAGGRAVGIQRGGGASGDDAGGDCPLHCGLCPGCHAAGVGVSAQVICLGDVGAHEGCGAVEDGRQLLTGDVLHGGELTAADALDDAQAGSPGDRVGVPGAGGHIGVAGSAAGGGGGGGARADIGPLFGADHALLVVFIFATATSEGQEAGG